MTEKKTNRGIFLLPSILTTFGMFAGFYSIIASINGDFTLAAISIMIAFGGKKIRAIAIASESKLLCTPCGGCRQRIRELSLIHI